MRLHFGELTSSHCQVIKCHAGIRLQCEEAKGGGAQARGISEACGVVPGEQEGAGERSIRLGQALVLCKPAGVAQAPVGVGGFRDSLGDRNWLPFELTRQSGVGDAGAPVKSTMNVLTRTLSSSPLPPK